jgi:hypothetical protein
MENDNKLFIDEVFGRDGAPYFAKKLEETLSSDGVAREDESMFYERPMNQTQGVRKLFGEQSLASTETLSKAELSAIFGLDVPVENGLEFGKGSREGSRELSLEQFFAGKEVKKNHASELFEKTADLRKKLFEAGGEYGFFGDSKDLISQAIGKFLNGTESEARTAIRDIGLVVA